MRTNFENKLYRIYTFTSNLHVEKNHVSVYEHATEQITMTSRLLAAFLSFVKSDREAYFIS